MKNQPPVQYAWNQKIITNTESFTKFLYRYVMRERDRVSQTDIGSVPFIQLFWQSIGHIDPMHISMPTCNCYYFRRRRPMSHPTQLNKRYQITCFSIYFAQWFTSNIISNHCQPMVLTICFLYKICSHINLSTRHILLLYHHWYISSKYHWCDASSFLLIVSSFVSNASYFLEPPCNDHHWFGCAFLVCPLRLDLLANLFEQIWQSNGFSPAAYSWQVKWQPFTMEHSLFYIQIALKNTKDSKVKLVGICRKSYRNTIKWSHGGLYGSFELLDHRDTTPMQTGTKDIRSDV